MLNLHNCHVSLDKQVIVQALSLQLEQGQIGCLLGPSGGGKTTLLRAIAGFIPLQTGTITVRGKVVSDKQYSLAAEQRNIGMVFQDFALFPHLNVAENVAFGIAKQANKQHRVTELLQLVGMQGKDKAYPHKLSGGQQQRVAIARALAPRPDILLLDEPFSSLDAELREQLASQVRNILKTEGCTALMVTHDQHEAFAIADHIGVLQQGKLQQWADAYTLYHQPASRFIANFIGEGAFIPATVADDGSLSTAVGKVIANTGSTYKPGQALQLLVRPDDIVYDSNSPFYAKVISKAFRGANILYGLQLEQGITPPLLCLTPSHYDHAIGDSFAISADIRHVIAFAL